ncbi:MAG: LacI family DNA-binding transcriptional regulator [Spirochaetales bacterium]|nr:LacI family DNA-binding transcriptional regulator [Spirochaetales bacterium]
MASLKDVARLAEVSVATASLALNGKSVNEKTREKVLKCAEKLGYVPNRGGQTLITGKSNTILMVLLNNSKYADLMKESTFFYNFMIGVLGEAQKRDYNFHLEVKTWDDPDLESFFRTRCHDKSADGVIVMPQYIKSYSFLPYMKNFPHVILNPCITDESMNYVMVEHEYGGSVVAELLVEKGFKDIAVIHGPQDHFDAKSRHDGFLNTLAKQGITLPDHRQYYSDFTIQSGYDGASHILEGKEAPDVIFCCNDFVAAGAMKYAREHGFSIPVDLSIIGYDNTDISRAVYPALTTVDAKLRDVGRAMAALLFRQIEDGETGIHSYIRPKLLIRETL